MTFNDLSGNLTNQPTVSLHRKCLMSIQSVSDIYSTNGASDSWSVCTCCQITRHHLLTIDDQLSVVADGWERMVMVVNDSVERALQGWVDLSLLGISTAGCVYSKPVHWAVLTGSDAELACTIHPAWYIEYGFISHPTVTLYYTLTCRDQCFQSCARCVQDIVEAVNVAEGIVHDTESKMEEFKDQIPQDDVRINSLCSSLLCDMF